MQTKYSLVLAFGLATVSLSSCSRASYSFINNAPVYSGTEQAHAVDKVEAVPVEKIVATTLPAISSTATDDTHTHQAATALAHRAPAIEPAATSSTAIAATDNKQLVAVATKSIKKKSRLFMSPKEAKAEGKSQLVALLLSFFLGGLGIHRFYLGYVGIGILELLTFGVFGILSLIDFIRIIIGTLKPKNGEYAKTL